MDSHPKTCSLQEPSRLQEFIWWKDGGAKVKSAILLAKAGAFSWNWPNIEPIFRHNGVVHPMLHLSSQKN